MSHYPMLRGCAGQFIGKEIRIPPQGLLIGRGSSTANRLGMGKNNTDISRKHCKIRYDQSRGVFIFVDLKSMNGSYLVPQEHRVHPNREVRCPSGQFIRLGKQNTFELVAADTSAHAHDHAEIKNGVFAQLEEEFVDKFRWIIPMIKTTTEILFFPQKFSNNIIEDRWSREYIKPIQYLFLACTVALLVGSIISSWSGRAENRIIEMLEEIFIPLFIICQGCILHQFLGKQKKSLKYTIYVMCYTAGCSYLINIAINPHQFPTSLKEVCESSSLPSLKSIPVTILYLFTVVVLFINQYRLINLLHQTKWQRYLLAYVVSTLSLLFVWLLLLFSVLALFGLLESFETRCA